MTSGKIVAVKRRKWLRCQRFRLEAMRTDARVRVLTRDFLGDRQPVAAGNRPIAESEKASLSAGVLCEDFVRLMLPKLHAEHGAVCPSVLTGQQFFQGSGRRAPSRRVPVASCRCCARTFWWMPTRCTNRAPWGRLHPADRRFAYRIRRWPT